MIKLLTSTLKLTEDVLGLGAVALNVGIGVIIPEDDTDTLILFHYMAMHIITRGCDWLWHR